MARKIVNNARFEILEDGILDKNDGGMHKFDTKSSAMVFLYENGVSVADIQRLLNCHYSFVYGVISKKFVIEKTSDNSKSKEFRKMYDEGKSVGQIAQLTNSNYSFVFGVIKKYKTEKEAAK